MSNQADARDGQTGLALRLQGLADPTVTGYVEALRKKYGKYSASAEEVRQTVDKSMGQQTLTGMLDEMRDAGH